MSARDAILARLRNAGPSPDRAAEARRLVETVERPHLAPAPAPETFLQALAGPTLFATHDRIASPAGIPGAVGRYLAGQALPPALYLPPDPFVAERDWSGFTLHDRCAPDEPAALAVARAGVAETGSLIFDTGPAAPMLPNFLGLHLIVLLRVETIVLHLEDIPASPALPRAHYWVTGVSGTTDIEGQYVRGAHGPRFLHVILLDGE